MASLLGQMFGGQANAPDMSNVTNLFNQRQGQIADFSNQLASARTQYMNQLNNYSQNVFSMFGKNLSAQFGAAGGSPGSGAFGSGLGREAAQLYGNLATTGYNTTAQGLEAVNNAYAGAYAPTLGAYAQGDMAQYQAQQGRIGALGQALGSAVGAGLQYGTGNYGLNSALMSAQGAGASNPAASSGGGSGEMSPYGPYASGYQAPGQFAGLQNMIQQGLPYAMMAMGR